MEIVMTLKAKVKDLTEVPEAFHTEYKQQGEEYVLDVEGGLKTNEDVTRLSSALTKERKDHSDTKTKLKPFEGLNLEEVQTQLARIPELEIAAEGKIDDKKIEKLVEVRLAQKVAPVQRELDLTKNLLGERTKEVEGFKVQAKTRTIHDAIRGAAGKVKLAETAIDDALLLGERVLDVDDQGRVFTKDGVGVTPGVEPEVWFTEMQSKRPHWWGASLGGGAGGNTGGGGAGKNPFTRENWNLTEQGQIATTNPSKAEQLAKAAGTTVGGGKPPPKA
jgi:hypothetical protein